MLRYINADMGTQLETLTHEASHHENLGKSASWNHGVKKVNEEAFTFRWKTWQADFRQSEAGKKQKGLKSKTLLWNIGSSIYINLCYNMLFTRGVNS